MNSYKPSRPSPKTNFKEVSAAVYRDKAIHNAFITHLLSNAIRQHLLENKTFDHISMFSQARALDSAQKSSE